MSRTRSKRRPDHLCLPKIPFSGFHQCNTVTLRSKLATIVSRIEASKLDAIIAQHSWMFISVNVEPETRETSIAALDALRAELEAKGVSVKEGSWGYRLLVVDDPDGNQLFFNYPNDTASGKIVRDEA